MLARRPVADVIQVDFRERRRITARKALQPVCTACSHFEKSHTIKRGCAVKGCGCREKREL